MFEWFENKLPAKGLKNWLTLVPSLQISRRKHLARKYA